MPVSTHLACVAIDKVKIRPATLLPRHHEDAILRRHVNTVRVGVSADRWSEFVLVGDHLAAGQIQVVPQRMGTLSAGNEVDALLAWTQNAVAVVGGAGGPGNWTFCVRLDARLPV